MFETVKEISKLLFDKSKSWGFKTAVFVSMIGLLFIFDMVLNFTYNIQVSNKLNQLEKIQILKNAYKSDTTYLKQIVDLEEKIINKKHYSEFLFFQASKISFKSKTNDHIVKNEITESNKKNIDIRSVFWMLFTSNFLLVLFFPFLLFQPLYDFKNIGVKSLSNWLASLILISLLMFFVTWTSFKIPLILNEPLFNYILNLLIHTFFWIIIYKLGKK